MSTSPSPIGYLFHCKSCGNPIVLRAEMLARPFEPESLQFICSESLGVACPNCKKIRNYSLLEKHPDHSESTSLPVERGVKTDCLGAFGCVEESCRIQTLLASPATATMTEADREREIDSWIWNDFHCNAGHPIEKPVASSN